MVTPFVSCKSFLRLGDHFLARPMMSLILLFFLSNLPIIVPMIMVPGSKYHNGRPKSTITAAIANEVIINRTILIWFQLLASCKQSSAFTLKIMPLSFGCTTALILPNSPPVFSISFFWLVVIFVYA